MTILIAFIFILAGLIVSKLCGKDSRTGIVKKLKNTLELTVDQETLAIKACKKYSILGNLVLVIGLLILFIRII